MGLRWRKQENEVELDKTCGVKEGESRDEKVRGSIFTRPSGVISVLLQRCQEQEDIRHNEIVHLRVSDCRKREAKTKPQTVISVWEIKWWLRLRASGDHIRWTSCSLAAHTVLSVETVITPSQQVFGSGILTRVNTTRLMVRNSTQGHRAGGTTVTVSMNGLLMLGKLQTVSQCFC